MKTAAILCLALAIVLAGCSSHSARNLHPTEIASFGDFKPPLDRPYFLACPENYCVGRPSMVTPLKTIPADRMRSIVRTALDPLPRFELLSSRNEGLRLVYHQGPGWDSSGTTITIDIVDADEGVSGIAFYSESDDGTESAASEMRQGKRWLAAIDRAIVAK